MIRKRHILVRILGMLLFLSGVLIEWLMGALFILITYVIISSNITAPVVDDINIGERVKVGENHYRLGNNWLKKNEYGIWEMYIEGDPYERGLAYGKLAKELVQHQEEIFVGQINELVPSKGWQKFLLLMLGFFNKELPNNIALENQQEIYGISKSFSDEFNYIAPKYDRILNYHAAHDIGHALNDYSMVGCTSFALKEDKSYNGELLIGRNFDFYVGDDFAEDKIILFVKPTKGHAFASYSWAGFTGVASGMNVEGLSVTINASKSDLPTGAKTPISLLAREILQYASTIDEAIEIAKQRNTFVSETLLISSKKDGKAILIEKSPTKLGVYAPESNALICANHYQSDEFIKDPVNIKNIKESDSHYRYERIQKLLGESDSLDLIGVARILRDQSGNDVDTLGMGNPRAVNQLIAHHSVVLQPTIGMIYISSNDFQLGNYLGYDLNKVFTTKKAEIEGTIPKDPFLSSEAYASFKYYKKIKQKIGGFITFGKPLQLSEKEISEFIGSNAESYITYEMLGRYFLAKKDKKKAEKYFSKALTKNVASKAIEKELETLVNECKK